MCVVFIIYRTFKTKDFADNKIKDLCDMRSEEDLVHFRRSIFQRLLDSSRQDFSLFHKKII